MILKFKVSDQNLTAVPTRNEPRKGSKDYLQLQFDFDANWKSYDKVLYFQHEVQKYNYSTPVTLTSDIVTVPAYYTQHDSFYITILGQAPGKRVPTNAAYVHLAAIGDAWEAQPPNPPPSWIDELQTLYNHPPKPGTNGYWMLWDLALKRYEESRIPLPEGSSSTGGGMGHVAFEVNDDGYLECHYTGTEVPTYRINDDGCLVVDIEE